MFYIYPGLTSWATLSRPFGTELSNPWLQVLSADGERLFPVRQINFKLPIFYFHTDRAVIP